MLGYIVSNKPELKVREAELYKAYYCGVCKSIGKNHGQLPRMILSYDAAFLALLLDSIDVESENLSREVCIANPFKKKAIAMSKSIDYAADVMLILGWFKILDDIRDDDKINSKILRGVYKSKFRKLNEAHPKLVDSIELNIDRLNYLEESRSSNLDEVADCFANIMKDIFSLGYMFVYDGKENLHFSKQMRISDVVGEIGYHLGRWVYIIDAIDDIDENLSKKTYNPILERFQYDGTEDVSNFKDGIKKYMEQVLIMSLDRVGQAIDLLPVKKNKGILENIIFVGLLKKTEEVLSINTKEEE